MKTPQEIWKAPFTNEHAPMQIRASNGVALLDMRGWGYLHTKFGEEEGAAIQDAAAARVLAILNAYWETFDE